MAKVPRLSWKRLHPCWEPQDLCPEMERLRPCASATRKAPPSPPAPPSLPAPTTLPPPPRALLSLPWPPGAKETPLQEQERRPRTRTGPESEQAPEWWLAVLSSGREVRMVLASSRKEERRGKEESEVCASSRGGRLLPCSSERLLQERERSPLRPRWKTQRLPPCWESLRPCASETRETPLQEQGRRARQE